MEVTDEHSLLSLFSKYIFHPSNEETLRSLQKIISHYQSRTPAVQDNFGKPFTFKTSTPRQTIRTKSAISKDHLKNLKMDSLKFGGSVGLDKSGESPKSVKNSAQTQKTSPGRKRPPKTPSNRRVSPAMGRWALLTRYNNILRNSTDDAEIVNKIVMEKFKNILNSYYHRSDMRKKPCNEDANTDDNQSANTQSVTSQDNGEKTESDSPEPNRCNLFNVICQNMAPLWEEEKLVSSPVNIQKTETNTVVKENIGLITSLEDQFSQQCFEEEVSAIANNTNTSDNNMTSLNAASEETLFEEKVQFDAQKFLEAALGKELHNYCSLNDGNKDDSETPFLSSTTNEANSSIGTSQISQLYKASMYLYNFFSGKARQRLHSYHTNTTTTVSYEELFTDYPYELSSRSSNLAREAAVQDQIILQTCKALNFCESSKSFKSSMQYVEAEKILLLAQQKYEALKKEIHKNEFEELKSLGKVTVSNLVFPAKGEVTKSDEICQWFFAVVQCGSDVLATETVKAYKDNDIQFDKSCVFENLDVDFEINVSLYTLYVKNSTRQDRCGPKFQTKQETTKCPTPRKFISCRKSRQSKLSESYERRNSSYILWGTTAIHIADLNKTEAFRLSQVPHQSTLKGIMNVNLSSSIEMLETLSGFLTIGSEAGGFAAWNRRWCYLRGYQLQYWNYPVEQVLTEPIGSIDLRFCVASRITQVDRELCARPRTLLLEIGRLSKPRDRNSLMVLCKDSYTITKHYLSADNHREMTMWQKQLNLIVSMLRNWNCMKCQLYFPR